jgi:hypothetical protein
MAKVVEDLTQQIEQLGQWAFQRMDVVAAGVIAGVELGRTGLSRWSRSGPEIQRPTIQTLQGPARQRALFSGAITIGSLALLAWNWPLALALATGVAMMALVYLSQQWDWQPWIRSLQPWVAGANRLVLVAVGLGGLAMVGTYVTTAIWIEAGGWVAIALGLQGLVLLLLVLIQGLGLGRTEPIDRLEQSLLDLTHRDPLNRLLALGQLGRRWPSLTEPQRQDIHQALQLLLAQEQEPIVRDRILGLLEPLVLEPSSNPRRLQRHLKILTVAPNSPTPASAPARDSAIAPPQPQP